ncbi:MAG: TonB-dependent receptor [Bacteroidales bacterium]|nr:TonB-dependent receptor [Bacteroidales bacterium]
MRKHLILLTSALMIFSAFTLAQQGTVSGTVSGDDGLPLPGATVQIKGTTTGVTTDLDGNYTLSVEGVEEPVLIFSYVGYLTEEIPVAGQTSIDVTLAVDLLTVDEVVVIGYGTQKKSLVTGSIAKVSSEELSKATATRFEQALQGKTSGVYIAQNSGEPGGGLTIKVRGNASNEKNEPIYLVDGVRTGGLEYLNPNDIESVEVLKDAASSAIYGAEGGNGVVMITTKKGKKGEGQLQYRYSYGLQQAADLPKVMNASEYRNYFIEATRWEHNRDSSVFLDLDVSNGTNWVDEIFEVAPMVEHQLSFSGGSEKTTYYLSTSYLDQDGIVGGPKNNMTRYTFRSNIETEVKPWFSVGVNASYTRKVFKPLDAVEQYGGIVTSATRYDPTVPVVWRDTSEMPDFYAQPEILQAMVQDGDGNYYSISSLSAAEMWNPAAKIHYTNRKQTQDKIVADFHANLKPVKWANLTTRIYTDYAYQVGRRFNGKTMYGVSDKVPADSLTNAEVQWDRWYKYGIENFVTFSNQFGNHYVELMIGQSYENYKYIWNWIKGYDIPYGDSYYAYPELGGNDNSDILYSHVTGWYPGQPQDIELKASYFGRFMYNYNERYLLQGSVRRDGSSKFGPKKKWGTFPAFSVGWNVHREDFFSSLAPLAFVSNLKLRASWGKNGSTQALTGFPYMSTLDIVDYVDGTPEGNLLEGKYPGTPGNAALLWETNVQTDIGADFGFFRNALTFSVDWYKRTTTDQLADKADQPLVNGLEGTAKINSGEVENKGWEFDLGYRGNFADLKYNISVNASYIKNKVIDYGVEQGKEGQNIGQLGAPTWYGIGEPVWYFYGYQALGIFQNQAEIDAYTYTDSLGNTSPIQPRAIPGDVIWADLDDDGVISGADRKNIGKSMPDWMFGFTLGVEYKGIELSAFFQGVTGNQIFWATFRTDDYRTNRMSVWYEDRWTGPGTSNTIPRATLRDANKNHQISSLNVFDGDYLRLKNLTLAYTLPNSLTSKVAIASLRIFYTGTNLLTFTKYPGLDPEVGNHDTNQPSLLGVDLGNYPTTKIHTFGVVVTF